MNEDIDFLIEKKEAELRPLCSRMEELRLQFIDDTVKFAAKWYTETAKIYVTKYPEITLSLSKEKLVSMKAKVNNLSRNAKKCVDNAFSDPAIWWHLTPRKHDSFSLYEQLGDDFVGNRFPEAVDKPVRRALGELGGILEQFGFNVTTGASKGAYPEFWFASSAGEGTPSYPYFPHLLTWSEEMQDTTRRYNSLFKKAIALYNYLEALKEEKKKQKATELWDST